MLVTKVSLKFLLTSNYRMYYLTQTHMPILLSCNLSFRQIPFKNNIKRFKSEHICIYLPLLLFSNSGQKSKCIIGTSKIT